MILIDLFCGAGGSAKGYSLAGFSYICGFDISPQKNYPFEFRQMDWMKGIDLAWRLKKRGENFAIHASPPCQAYSKMTARWGRQAEHPDLVEPVRDELVKLGVSYVIENVQGAPLINPVTLCGSMFGLKVRRHRLFETNFLVIQPECNHRMQGKVVGVYGHSGGSSKRDGLVFSGTNSWREAMGIDWMTGKELAESIPPAYTKYVGEQLLTYLQ